MRGKDGKAGRDGNDIFVAASEATRGYSAEEKAALGAAWAEHCAEFGMPVEGAALSEEACGLGLDRLPGEARVVDFADLAREMSADPRGYALLSGWEDGAAGLELFRVHDDFAYRGKMVSGNSFSFCANGSTFTFFENPDDGYRSSMEAMVMRPGNWCRYRFEPVALLPRFLGQSVAESDEDALGRALVPQDPEAGSASTFALLVPGSTDVAMEVGTDFADDYYPVFVASADAAAIMRAAALGIALAHQLEANEGLGASVAAVARPGPRL